MPAAHNAQDGAHGTQRTPSPEPGTSTPPPELTHDQREAEKWRKIAERTAQMDAQREEIRRSFGCFTPEPSPAPPSHTPPRRVRVLSRNQRASRLASAEVQERQATPMETDPLEPFGPSHFDEIANSPLPASTMFGPLPTQQHGPNGSASSLSTPAASPPPPKSQNEAGAGSQKSVQATSAASPPPQPRNGTGAGSQESVQATPPISQPSSQPSPPTQPQDHGPSGAGNDSDSSDPVAAASEEGTKVETEDDGNSESASSQETHFPPPPSAEDDSEPDFDFGEEMDIDDESYSQSSSPEDSVPATFDQELGVMMGMMGSEFFDVELTQSMLVDSVAGMDVTSLEYQHYLEGCMDIEFPSFGAGLQYF